MNTSFKMSSNRVNKQHKNTTPIYKEKTNDLTKKKVTVKLQL